MEKAHQMRRWLFTLLAVLMIVAAAPSRTMAANMVSSAKKNKVTNSTMVGSGSKIRFKTESGYLKNTWVSCDGKIYSLKKNGYAKKGWFKENGAYYYADKKTCQVQVRKMLQIGKKTYYLKADGTRVQSSFLNLKKNRYYFAKNGVMNKKKQFKVSGKYYYADANGVIAEDEIMKIGKYLYYFDEDGVRQKNTTVKVDGVTYALDGKGRARASKVSAGVQKVQYLFVGDSRTVGMDYAISEQGTAFIGKVSMGYNWCLSTADSQIRAYLKSNPEMKVIFGFGINDLGNVQKYIAYYKKLVAAYPRAQFIFLSINPISEAKSSSPYVSNKLIRAFNATLKAAMGSRYLDTYSYLSKNGFGTNDGIHYTASTYVKLYNYILSKID